MSEFQAHMLWVKGDLSNLERLCINSFVNQGYAVNLWTYGDISNEPAGVQLRDAREVLGEDQVFANTTGSYANFSDLFRYAVLNALGGLWADCDVVALTPAATLPKSPFLVSERVPNRPPGRAKINGNIIFNPRPKPGNVIDLAYVFSLRFPKADITWSEIGPDLLSAIATIYHKHGFLVQPPEFANPVDWWNCPRDLLRSDFRVNGDPSFLHCYNETWRKSRVDKNGAFPKGSIMASLAERYL